MPGGVFPVLRKADCTNTVQVAKTFQATGFSHPTGISNLFVALRPRVLPTAPGMFGMVRAPAPPGNLAVAVEFLLKYHRGTDLRTAKSTANWRWTWRCLLCRPDFLA
jgi:hypothetical protein